MAFERLVNPGLDGTALMEAVITINVLRRSIINVTIILVDPGSKWTPRGGSDSSPTTTTSTLRIQIRSRLTP
ncbi:hypothetical protein QJS10_CPA01g02307 [Acorus calamus]|uniref:Uncharacterized protein n=1 Tax=Acorus calamus TaxID=4465 RepID=A0AAV9FLZ4_ACOCL|nr:hypothetical protein QJS10_CPA01g02307 [Acorus calamus]